MADTFSAKALRGYTLHTPKGFVIFNEGQETRFIPEDQRDKLVKQGVIADDDETAAPSGESDGLDSMTKAELHAEAKKRGITVETDANKAALLAALRAGGAEAPPAD